MQLVSTNKYKQEGMTSHMDYKNADRLKKLQTKY